MKEVLLYQGVSVDVILRLLCVNVHEIPLDDMRESKLSKPYDPSFREWESVGTCASNKTKQQRTDENEGALTNGCTSSRFKSTV